MVDINKGNDKGNSLCKIKSKKILDNIFGKLSMNKLLEIIRYNKYIQNRINKDINFYKQYLQIVLEIIPKEKVYGNFINIINKENKGYYHIYFNGNKEEIKRNYITEKDNAAKIKIGIDYEIKNLYGLFKECNCIKIMNFIQFNRKVTDDMSYLFSRCSTIEEINFFNFITDNVTNMSYMFYECSSLKKLNLSNFNTKNVINMRGMFCGCSSLRKINVDGFDISKIENMIGMFDNCKSFEIICSDEFKKKIKKCG